MRHAFWTLLCSAAIACAQDFRVLRTIPHEANSFTQGLSFYNGGLYESVGLYGSSELRRVDLESGEVIERYAIDEQYFAEGITIVDNKIYMLTWRENALMTFDADSLEYQETMRFSSFTGEGWGLTHYDLTMVCSDGSQFLTFWKAPQRQRPKPRVLRQIAVTDASTGQAQSRINELEFAHGYIYANIWYSNEIIKIDPDSGVIVRRFDLSALYPMAERIPEADCLNGIAFNQTSNTFLITGKNWPLYYEVELPGVIEDMIAYTVKVTEAAARKKNIAAELKKSEAEL